MKGRFLLKTDRQEKDADVCSQVSHDYNVLAWMTIFRVPNAISINPGWNHRKLTISQRSSKERGAAKSEVWKNGKRSPHQRAPNEDLKEVGDDGGFGKGSRWLEDES